MEERLTNQTQAPGAEKVRMDIGAAVYLTN